LGRALLQRFCDAGWILRAPSSRALRVTHEGTRAFGEHFEIDVAALDIGRALEGMADIAA
jgi:hypothetical protein